MALELVSGVDFRLRRCICPLRGVADVVFASESGSPHLRSLLTAFVLADASRQHTLGEYHQL